MSTLTDKLSNVSKLIRQTIGSALSSVHAGDDKMTSRQHPSIGSLSISSPDFSNGLAIPPRFTPQGENISPELTWSGVPLETKELVLIVEDPDAPMVSPFVHWIIRGLNPSVGGLPQRLAKTAHLVDLPGAVQGKNDAKEIGWYGPKPPLGHGVHHYHFQLFALDRRLDLDENATLNEIKLAMENRILADGETVGTYERTADSD